MRAEAQGIILFAPELRALLAAKDPENPLSVVHFRVEREYLYVYATNGHRAIEAIATAHVEAQQGEWTVLREFLDAGRKLVGQDEYLVLDVSGASLNRAVVRHKETLEDKGDLNWATDAASTQTTFPVEGLRNSIELPTTQRSVRCVSINARYLSELTLVAGAAGSDMLDLFPGKTRNDPLVFRIQALDETEWKGAIMPLRTQSDAEAEDIFANVTVTVTRDGTAVEVPIGAVDEALKKKRKKLTEEKSELELPFPEGTDEE